MSVSFDSPEGTGLATFSIKTMHGKLRDKRVFAI